VFLLFLCVFKVKRIIYILILLVIIFSIFTLFINSNFNQSIAVEDVNGVKYIKWVSFNVTYPALKKAMDLDILSHNKDGYKYNWIEILSYLGAKYGGKFSKYKDSDMDEFVKRLESGEKIEDITKDMKFYTYYLEAYTAVLGEFVGNYKIQVLDKLGNINWQEKYGLKVFSPIAAGYYYNDYDDFGAGREFGYKRKHLGHDMFGNIGTPIIAVESGIVEELGWNRYGGWRIGIRSFDKKRYYYYAHLRKDYPYVKGLEKGKIVKAGDVIGYLGRTGYSTDENVNNIEENHLHFGTQLIFNESQKDGINQIWIDDYSITKLLNQNRSKVKKVEGSKEYTRVYDFFESNLELYNYTH
jgi:murein DD-endopeptidase MepM/ murein hydrolase activator NlpD